MSIRMELDHKPSGHGHGKWQNTATLWRYKLARRKANKVAAASRRRNRQ